MNVLMISPGFPDEMPLFTRGLAEIGASVFGIGDQPQAALAPRCGRAWPTTGRYATSGTRSR